MAISSTIANLIVKVGADISGLTSGLATANSKVQAFAGKLDSMGNKLAVTGGVMTAAFTRPIVAGFSAAVAVAGDFEEKMAILGIAARDSGASVDELSKAARNMGTDTQLISIDAIQAADAMTAFAKAGLSVSDMFGGQFNQYLREGTNMTGAMRAAVDLAAASELTLAEATEVVITGMSTYGISAENARSITDSYVRSADASVASVSGLADAMANVGPVMAMYGYTLQDVNTALALMSSRGILGAEAGTALKSMMTNMLRQTKKVVGAWDELGISLYGADGQLKKLPQIIGELNAAMAGMSEEQRNYYIQTLAGTYGMKAMTTLLAEGTDGWNAQAKAVENAATTQQVAAERAKTWNAAMENLHSTWQDFQIAMGDALKKALLPFVQALTKFLAKITATPGMVDKIVKALVILATVGPALIIVGTALKFIAGVLTALTTIAHVVGFFVSLAGAVVTLNPAVLAVIAVIGALYLAFKHNFLGIRDAVMVVWESIKNTFGMLKGVWQDFTAFLRGEMTWEELVEDVGWMWKAIQQTWKNAGDKLKEIWDQNLGKIGEWFHGAWADVQEWAGKIVGTIEEWFAGLGPKIAGWLSKAGEAVGGFFKGIWDKLGGVWAKITGRAEEGASGIDGAWDMIRAGATVFAEVAAIAIQAWTDITASTDTNMALIKFYVESAYTDLRLFTEQTWTNMLANASTQWSLILSAVTGGATSMKDRVITIMESMRAGYKTVLDGMVADAYLAAAQIASAFGGYGGAAATGYGSSGPAPSGFGAGGAGSTSNVTNSQPISIVVNNPQAERSSLSTMRALRNLSALGVLLPSGA